MSRFGLALLLAVVTPAITLAAPGSEPPGFSTPKALVSAPVSRFPALPLDRLLIEDALVTDKSAPWRYAMPLPAENLRAGQAGESGGQWSTLADGRLLWRFEVNATDAKSIDLQFQPYRLPHDAELWVYTPDRSSVAGPFTDQHNNPSMILATPALPGDRVIVEVAVPAASRKFLNLALDQVYSGYRGFDFADGHPVPKSGNCNVDVICPQGDAFRNQIQSVVRYTVSGGLCTGTLMNTTAQNGDPLMLTARHCFSTQTAAAGIVAYYNYNSPSCRTVGSAANGVALNPNISTHTQSGTTLLASSTSADFSLVRFNQTPPSGANVYFAGWDRRDLAPSSATGIHHPSGDEKRISMDNNPLQISTSVQNFESFQLATGHALRIIDWDSGTTEQGSSGSALFSPEKRVVGTLSGGSALCGNDLSDYYGRLFISFTGGGSSSTRLSDHLDPTGSGVQTLDGRAPGGTGGTALTVSLAQSPAQPKAGEDVTFTATVSGGTPPYDRVAWDIDGDGTDDRTIINVPAGSSFLTLTTRYSREQSLTAKLVISDTGSTTVTTTRAVDVQSHVMSADMPTAAQVCGDGDNTFDPGERWRLNFRLSNFGDLAPSNARAIFYRTLLSGNQATDLQVTAPAATVAEGITGQGTVSTEFYIKPGAPCGSSYAVRYIGTVDARGTSGAESGAVINVAAACNVVSNCPAPTSITSIRQGAYYNPVRGGNGLISFIVPQNSGPPIFYAQWFTGEANRQPTWYYIQTSLIDGQAFGNVVRRTRNVSAPGFVTSDVNIGTAQITLLGNEQLVFTYQLSASGQPRSGELMSHLLTGLSVANPNRTGAYFYDQEGGWGQTYDSYIANGVSTEFGLTYVYDTTGAPRWVLTQAAASNTVFNTISYQSHCPNCAWLDIAPTGSTSGTMTRQFSSRTTGTLSTSFTVPGGGTWTRNSVPIQLLTTQQAP